MDFSKNSVLKENYSFLTASSDAHIEAGEHGLYNRDTRFLHRYVWRLPAGLQLLMQHSSRPDRLNSHSALLDHHHQLLAVRRDLELSNDTLSDTLRIESNSREPYQLRIELEFAADFADLFEVRGWAAISRDVAEEVGRDQVSFSYRARDGLDFSTELRFNPPPEVLEAQRATYLITLDPRARFELSVEVRMVNPLERTVPTISYPDWRQRFTALPIPTSRQAVVERAVDDLRALLLFTEQGPLPAAGIPWFVAAFGRDSLLTAAMMLPYAPEVAEGTLRYLAGYQGRKYDPYTAEAPGKIMHELRFGELSRTGETPHSPYYGTIDATPLFLVLLDRLTRQIGSDRLISELRPNWEAALEWMIRDGDVDGDGFLEFTPAAPGAGLTVQSWKDSEDSLSHSDGTLAQGLVAVSEVQGYAFEAYLAARRFYDLLGEQALARQWGARAQALQREFHRVFWLDELRTYALALDGEKRPLAVHNSDAGHLLWSGIVPGEAAPVLVETLFSPANWSGWGFRTLGQDEWRYNPVSYHNGSVWPHDSALIAGGLHRYGFRAEAARVKEALLDLAASQPDLRLPELVGGYLREDESGGKRVGFWPPIPYPTACRPQAWDAAAVIYVLGLSDS